MTDSDIRQIAVFDFDGTLAEGDAVIPFCIEVAGRRAVAGALLRNWWLILLCVINRDNRDRLKAALSRAVFAGRRETDVRIIAMQFAQARLMKLNTSMRKRFEWHRRQGHEVVIASASFEHYMLPIGSALGVEAVICTSVAAENGVFTGELEGRNMRGAAKASEVSEYIGDRKATVWAYGNSSDDHAMLALADHAFLVDKKGRLHAFHR